MTREDLELLQRGKPHPVRVLLSELYELHTQEEQQVRNRDNARMLMQEASDTLNNIWERRAQVNEALAVLQTAADNKAKGEDSNIEVNGSLARLMLGNLPIVEEETKGRKIDLE